MPAVSYPHIELNSAGEAVISGTNTKVVLLAIDRLAHHWDADEIRRQRPHLTLGQIYAALAYYYDHDEEINRQIEDRARREDVALGSLGESRVAAKFRAMTEGR